MSTGMVLAYPGLFAGLIPMGGVVFDEAVNLLPSLRVKLGVYLFAGETCFNRKESENALDVIQEAGIPVALMIGPGLGHETATTDQCLEIYDWFQSRRDSAENATSHASGGQ